MRRPQPSDIILAALYMVVLGVLKYLGFPP